MKRALLITAAVALACGSNNNIVGSGQFSAPTALAVVPAADRDLIFVAGTGRDGLRALELCEFIDSDGNIQAACPEDQQFVPGPIRVFPANIETFDRPLHLAGAWLTDAGVADPDPDTFAATDAGSRQGVVLVAGADKTVRFVDANKVLEAVNSGQLADPGILPIDGIATDVVVDNFYKTGAVTDLDADTLAVSPSVQAFVATTATGTVPAELTQFTVTLDANGNAVVPDPAKSLKCALTGVLPTRMAIAPRETPPPNEQPTTCNTAVAGTCLLDVPQPTDDIFIGNAGGTGGVVRVKRNSLAVVAPGATPPTCAMTLIGAQGHGVRSLSLSPQWYETIGIVPANSAPDAGVTEAVNINHPAGELLMMVLTPNKAVVPAAGQPNLQPDPGGVLIADLCTYSPPIAAGDNAHCQDFDGGTIVPIPPFRYDQLSPGAAQPGVTPQEMEPIAPGGVAQEVTFMRAFRPLAVAGQADLACIDGACTAVFVGQNIAVANIFLLGAVSSTDGATYFIDTVHRRFVNGNFYNLANTLGTSLDPQIVVSPALSPASSVTPQPEFDLPILDRDDATAANPNDVHPTTLWIRPGVTHTGNWFIIWHGVLPGLGRLGANVTELGNGHLFVDVPPASLAAAQADPVLNFGPGDNLSFLTFLPPPGATDACKAVLNVEGSLPLSFEAEVVAINPDGSHPDRVEIAIDTNVVHFDESGDCPTFSGVAEFHTGGNLGKKPWIVQQGDTILTRLGQGETYVARERRFDYPFDYNPTDAFPLPNFPPVAATDEGLSFTLGGSEPLTPGSQWSFSLLSNLLPLLYADSVVVSGYATGIVPYASAANSNTVFTAVTGSNSLVMAEPAILGTSTLGLRVFR